MGGSRSRRGSNTSACRAGSNPVDPVKYAAAKHPTIAGCQNSRGPMYFFALKADSTTPFTGLLRLTVPGTCGITIAFRLQLGMTLAVPRQALGNLLGGGHAQICNYAAM